MLYPRSHIGGVISISEAHKTHKHTRPHTHTLTHTHTYLLPEVVWNRSDNVLVFYGVRINVLEDEWGWNVFDLSIVTSGVADQCFGLLAPG